MAVRGVLLIFSFLLISVHCDLVQNTPNTPKHSRNQIEEWRRLEFLEYRVGVLEEHVDALRPKSGVQCGQPPSVNGTEVVNASSHNDMIIYKCRAGFLGSRSRISLCTDKGVWTPVDMKCCDVSAKSKKWFGRAVYTGNIATTMTGQTCQRWNVQSPHEHQLTYFASPFGGENIDEVANYCRDPDGDGYLWCYTTNRLKRWDKCNVPKC